MDCTYYAGNRRRLYDTLTDGTAVLLGAGHAPRKTADENYPFYCERNFLYLTGVDREDFLFLAVKQGGAVEETLYILPPDVLAERWTGIRMKEAEARERSGIREIRYLAEFDEDLHQLIQSGRISAAALDLYKHDPADRDTSGYLLAKRLKKDYPALSLIDISPQLRKQRTIKQPCEIEAMRKAISITREGILAMMRASRPGMYEYEYKAEFDRALTSRGCLEPAFPSIVCAGKNNFCIHYYDYTGQAKDGDMILNDVGAKYDGMGCDVSRGWPCNGRFDDRQRALYTCAYRTSQHMFSIIRPGMAMKDVDRLAREYDFEQLKALGLCGRLEDAKRYIWHGGAHHVGLDVHDLVDVTLIEPGMVFCVDIGIYCEEWGIGFRLEDNCLVTENGCENLTVSIPRSIEEIEAVMKKQETR